MKKSLLLLLLVPACISQSDIDDGSLDMAAPQRLFEYCGPETETLLVQTVDLAGDVLVADATYTGCREDSLRACWDQTFAEYPMSATVRLVRKQKRQDGTVCTPVEGRQVRIDLGTMRRKFQRQYETAEGEVLLTFHRDQLSYQFDASSIPTAFIDRLKDTAQDAKYMSDADHPISVVVAQNALDRRITTARLMGWFENEITTSLGASMDQLGADTYGATEALELLTDAADPENDTNFAWRAIEQLVKANLTGLKLVKIGPKADDGSLLEDRGTYLYLLAGKFGHKVVALKMLSLET